MDPHDHDERAILSAYRADERMPPASREAAWARLQAAIHEAPDQPAEPPMRPRWVPMLLFAAALVLLIVGLRRGLAAREANDDAGHAAPDLVDGVNVERTRTSPPATPQPATSQPATSPVVIEPEPSTRAPPRSIAAPAREPTADQAGLDVELGLLREARGALATGDAARALALIDEHERRLTNGHLVEERRLLQIQAMCALGQKEPAQAAARRFAADYPASPHTPTIADLCGP